MYTPMVVQIVADLRGVTSKTVAAEHGHEKVKPEAEIFR